MATKSSVQELLEFLREITHTDDVEEFDPDVAGMPVVGIMLANGHMVRGAVIRIGDSSLQVIDPSAHPTILLRTLVPYSDISSITVSSPKEETTEPIDTEDLNELLRTRGFRDE